MALIIDEELSAVEKMANIFNKINWHKSHSDKLCDKIHELSLETYQISSNHMTIKGWHKILMNYRVITNKDIPILNKFLSTWPYQDTTSTNDIIEPKIKRQKILVQTTITNMFAQTTNYSPTVISVNPEPIAISDDNRPGNTHNTDPIDLNKMKYKKTGVRTFNKKTKIKKRNQTHRPQTNI